VVRGRADIEVEALEWDDVNLGHLARHGVSQAAAESVLIGEPRFFHNLEGRGGTHVMIGLDFDGRYLYVSIRESDVYVGYWRPITGWRLGRRGPRLYNS
jgi:hypothetical protein